MSSKRRLLRKISQPIVIFCRNVEKGIFEIQKSNTQVKSHTMGAE